MSDFRDYLNNQLQDETFKKEFDKSKINYEVMRLLVTARCEQNISQKELSTRTGIKQSNISRIENGMYCPSLSTLEAIAKGLGKKLHVEFL